MVLGYRRGPATRAIAGLIFGVLGVACSRQDAPERSFEQLRADLTRVQADRDRLEERLIALENAEQKRNDSERRSGRGDGSSDGRTLPVVRIGAPSDSRPFEVDVGNDDGDGNGAKTMGPASQAAGRANRDRTRTAKAATDGKREYDAAVTLARAKQYDKAVDALTAFLVRYPDHEFTDQAMYWRGECFYGQGANGRAAEQLQGLMARFPISERVPDALLKLGLAQQRLGAAEQAQRTFADLKQRYPKSDAARQVPRP